jgi:hypothetical protein
VTLEAQDDLRVIDSTAQPAGTCAACGQSIGVGEGITALYGGRLLRFRCSGCLASFRSEPGRFVAARDYCCDTDTRVESPASEWVV